MADPKAILDVFGMVIWVGQVMWYSNVITFFNNIRDYNLKFESTLQLQNPDNSPLLQHFQDQLISCRRSWMVGLKTTLSLCFQERD